MDSAWAGALPAAGAVPVRPPIVLTSDDTLVRAVTRAVLRATLPGRQGLVLGAAAVVFGYAVATVYGAPSWWQVGVAALGMFLLEVLLAARSVARAIRRLLPAGRTVRSWYAAPDVLSLETGTGRTDLRPGSLRSARRRGPVTCLRLRRNRGPVFLPSGLLTDDDLALLTGPLRPGTPAAEVATDLPLLLVVTERTRRDLRRAVVGWMVRRRQMVALLVCATFLLAVTYRTGQWAEVLIAAVLLALWGAQVLAALRLFSRSYLPGGLVRAGLAGDRLRLQTGDDLVDEVQLGSVRQCHVGRHHVRLDLGRERPHLFLPRDLFPAAQLAELQRRVAGT